MIINGNTLQMFSCTCFLYITEGLFAFDAYTCVLELFGTDFTFYLLTLVQGLLLYGNAYEESG